MLGLGLFLCLFNFFCCCLVSALGWSLARSDPWNPAYSIIVEDFLQYRFRQAERGIVSSRKVIPLALVRGEERGSPACLITLAERVIGRVDDAILVLRYKLSDGLAIHSHEEADTRSYVDSKVQVLV